MVQMVLTGGRYIMYYRLPMETFKDVIAAWPSLEAMAEDAGTTVGAIKQWRNRAAIPGDYWLALEVGAAKRSIPGVTTRTLAGMALAKRPPPGSPDKPEEAAA